ncbi:MAG: 4-diphosphocytidyl-2-C-methyl-D-erythritol kinase [Flavobacteriales bacterium]|jgi:4-diphosphocytidyl-2-C-methyl-D-erythritol kinase
MVRFPKAKINIGLSITGRREDGYHNLESIFVPIPLYDVLEAVTNTSGSFNIALSGLSIQGEKEDNLVYKAWDLLREAHGISGVDVALMKVIPMGAGLGGGSSDGAHMLLLLNALFDLGLSLEELKNFAAQLGSDCPFFIDEITSFVSGRGELLSPVELDLSGKHLALINPKIHVGTAEAYSLISPHPALFDLRKLKVDDLNKWSENVVNDFEAPIADRYNAIEVAKKELISAGASYASMTGSGSTVYGIFEKSPKLELAKDWFYWTGKL